VIVFGSLRGKKRQKAAGELGAINTEHWEGDDILLASIPQIQHFLWLSYSGIASRICASQIA